MPFVAASRFDSGEGRFNVDGSLIWFFGLALGTLALGAGLIYGLAQSRSAERTQTPAQKRLREEETRKRFHKI